MAGTKRPAEGPEKATTKKVLVQSGTDRDISKSRRARKPVFTSSSSEVIDAFQDSSVAEYSTVGKAGTDHGVKSKLVSSEDDRSERQNTNSNGTDAFLNGSTSREAHSKQKTLAQERKAAKPNADSIAQSKKLWERLRRKSHVPSDERKVLVKELFGIIDGRVKDFVFKHDAVRVIQTAIKYGTPDQKKQIARELQGGYRALAKSRYAKFLIAKLVVGDDEIRDIIVPELYGEVKRLIRHPEASWIMDDIYRTIATPEQKAHLLREWYGPEFVIFKAPDDAKSTAELSIILAQHPEKRGPIMQHLRELTNQLVQKKTTGFTMLHDALLQYFLNCRPGSPEAIEFLVMLKDDEEGNCYKNLAFTKSGCRLTCLALAYGSSRDRRTIVKFFKGVMKILAGDVYGHLVLLAAYDVIDDTVMTAKAIFPELLGEDLRIEERQEQLLAQVDHLSARVPLLYLLVPGRPKWLLSDYDAMVLDETWSIRSTTSKKDEKTRRNELVRAISQPLLDLIVSKADVLVTSSFGCQFLTEVIFGAEGEKEAALKTLASLAEEKPEVFNTPHAGRLLKTLVQGGRFNKETKSVEPLDKALGFENILYGCIKHEIMSWAIGPNAFVIVAMLESGHFLDPDGLLQTLTKHRTQLEVASAQKSDGEKGNPGARILVEKIKKQ